MNKTFDIKKSLNYGWEMMEKYFWYVMGIFAITFIVNMVLQAIAGIPEMVATKMYPDLVAPFMDEAGNNVQPSIYQGLFDAGQYNVLAGLVFSMLVLFLITYFFQMVLAYNQTKMTLSLVENKKQEYKSLFVYEGGEVWNWLLSSFAYAAVVIVGLILLIIPGIYLALKYMYVPYLVLDKKMGIKDAFNKSAEMTDGNKWKIIGLGITSFAVVLLGIVCLIIGVFPATVVVTFASVYVYKLLVGDINEEGQLVSTGTASIAEPAGTEVSAA